MNFKRTLVKYTAALSIFFTGISTISVAATVHADEVSAPVVTTVKKTSAVAKKRNAIVKLAKKEIGKPYVWGATGPSAFDCSGLTTYGQITLGKTIPVSTKTLKKGDLLFWGNYHVGIYIGGGKFVHAPAPGQNVKTQTLASFFPSSAKRVIN